VILTVIHAQHTCNTGRANCNLYIATQLICVSTQYIVMNNNTKCKEQVEVESVPTPRHMSICINIPIELRIQSNNVEWY
jgi:hypothetical protein